MAKGIEYILSVIDRATAPLQKVLGNLDKVEQSFAAIEENEIKFSIRDFTNEKITAIRSNVAAVKDKWMNFSVRDYASGKAAEIKGKVEQIRDKAVSIYVRETGKMQEIGNRLAGIKDKVVNFSARDFVTEKATNISNRVGAIRDKVVNFSLRDAATATLKKIENGIDNTVMAAMRFQRRVENINVRDTVSPVFQRITNAANNLRTRAGAAFDGVRNRIRLARTEADALGGSVNKISFGGVFRSLGGPMIAAGLTAGALFGGAISKGMEKDLQKTNITTLMRGDVDKANQLFSQLSDYSIKTPYEKADIIEGQKTMMSFGLSSEYAFEKLKNIGDIAMGDAQKMQSLSLAFSQATSAGKLQGQDLLQMINAGFNPLQVISERTGESMVSLRERMEKGGISAVELGRAFEMATDKQGLFYQGAEKAGNTFAGKVSNMKEAVGESLTGIYDQLKPLLLPAIIEITEWIPKIGEAFANVFGYIRSHADTISTVANGIKDAFVGVFDFIGDHIEVIKALAIGYVTAKGFALLWAGALKVAAVWQGISTGATALGTFAQIALGNAYVVATGKTGLLAAAQWALNAAWAANPVGIVILAITALVGAVVYAWNNFVKFRAVLTGIWEFLKSFTQFIITGPIKVFQALGEMIIGAITFNVDKIASGFNKAKSVVFDGAKGMADAFNKGYNSVIQEDKNRTELEKISADIDAQHKESKIGKYGGSTSEKFEKIKPPKTDGSIKDAAGAGAGKAKGINEGGSRPTTINITIQKLQDQIVINAGSVKEGAKQAANDVVNELLLALNSVDAKGGLSYE